MLLFALGCSDHQVGVLESEPEVSVTAPADGESYALGATVHFEAVVDDDDDKAEDMAVAWASSLDGGLDGEASADGEQVSLSVVGLSPGKHLVTVTVTDPDAHSAEDSVTVEIRENEAPTLAFVSPTGGVEVADDGELVLELEAADADQPVSEASVSWSADSGTVSGDGSPASDGSVEGTWSGWDLGPATLTVTLTDAYGDTAVATLEITVSTRDADGDGHDAEAHGGGDCDDDDAEVNPDADELWYDGIDDDCDGNDGDADGDGHEADVVGGDDCDDEDAAVNPAADELWYDGVDDDCDGNDGDADGDGYDALVVGGDDCDDEDAAVNPAAEEAWYDGVDGDCDGLSDLDADGDGHDDEASGGDDCDDTDPAVSPSEDETCNDGVDNDCDGTAGDCAWTGEIDLADADVVVQGAAYSDELGYAIAGVPDSDGDGFAELLVGTDSYDGVGGNSGGVWLVQGAATLLGSVTVGDAGTLAFTADAAGDFLGATVASGDVDGDGYADAVLGASRYAGGSAGSDAGGVYVLSGPLTASMAVVDGSALLEGADNGDHAGESLAVMDLDGDGLDDLLVGAPSEDSGANDGGAAYVVLGASLGGTLSLADADTFFYGGDSYYDMGESAAPAGDVDGDGLEDVLLGVPGSDDGGENRAGAVQLYLGDAKQFAAGSTFTSAQAELEVYGSEASDELGSAVLGLGDLDGSGRGELALGAQGAAGTDSARGVVYVLLDVPSGSAYAEDEALAVLSGNGNNDDLGYALGTSDLGGTGVPGLVLGNELEDTSASNAGAAHYYEDVTALADGEVGEATDAWFLGGNSNDKAGVAVTGVADLDGDGLEELAIGAPGYDGTAGSAGAVFVFYGLGI